MAIPQVEPVGRRADWRPLVVPNARGYSDRGMRMKRRTFLIGSVSGLSLLAVSACTPEAPKPTPTVPTVPSLVPQPIAVQRTNWSADPYFYGAFSYAAVNSGPDDRVAMR